MTKVRITSTKEGRQALAEFEAGDGTALSNMISFESVSYKEMEMEVDDFIHVLQNIKHPATVKLKWKF